MPNDDDTPTSPNYHETAAQATMYRRAHYVQIFNPLEDPSSRRVFFQEEDVVTIAGQILNKQLPASTNMQVLMDPADGVIPLLNPETGESLGVTSTHLDLYVLLYSLYIQVAKARDALNAPAPEVPPEDLAP